MRYVGQSDAPFQLSFSLSQLFLAHKMESLKIEEEYCFVIQTIAWLGDKDEEVFIHMLELSSNFLDTKSLYEDG